MIKELLTVLVALQKQTAPNLKELKIHVSVYWFCIISDKLDPERHTSIKPIERLHDDVNLTITMDDRDINSQSFEKALYHYLQNIYNAINQ